MKRRGYRTEPQRKDQKHPLCYDQRCGIHTTLKTNVALRAMFARASSDFLAANAVQVNVERSRAQRWPDEEFDYETDDCCEIPNSEQCEQTPALGSEGEGKASGARRPLIGFTLYRVKLLDWEAKYSSVKDLLDGCVTAGLLDGDREDQIDPKSYVRQVKVKSYAEEKTVIIIDTD